MKLCELMNHAFDETWFCVVTPDGNEHYFWNADYLGWHPDVMPELEPLLDREFDEFELVIRNDPEAEDVANADKVLMVYVALSMTDEELKRHGEAVRAEEKKRRIKEINDRIGKIGVGDRVDYAKIRMEVPSKYVIAFHEDGDFIIYGKDAVGYKPYIGRKRGVYLDEQEGPLLMIHDATAKAMFQIILDSGRGLALCNRRSECFLPYSKWEVYKLVDDQSDLKSWEKNRVG